MPASSQSLLLHVFGVKPNEQRLVLAFFAFFAGIGMFYTVGVTVADTLLLSSLPAARVPAVLPLVYAGVGAANVLAMLAFDALSARLRRPLLLVGVQVLLASSVLLCRGLLELGGLPIYYGLVVWMELCATLSITLFFTFAGDYFATRDARRLYGFIAGGMSLGTVVSGAAIERAVAAVGTANLLYAGAGLLLGNAALCRHILRIGTPVVHESPRQEDSRERAALPALAADTYVRHVATALVLAVAVSVIADYQMKWAASEKSGEELARFFGAFFTWVGLAQLLFQFVLVPRLLGLLGIIPCLMILPLSLGVASVVLLSGVMQRAFGIPLLVLTATTNFLRLTISETLDIPTRELLFLPLPTRVRVRAQPLLAGAIAPATQALTGLLLLGCFALAIPVERLSLLLLLAAVMLVWTLVRLRPLYRKTLAGALREHRLDPTDLERILHSPNVEPILQELLRSRDPDVARATLLLIRERDVTGLVPVLHELLDSSHDALAIAALRLLVAKLGGAARPAIERCSSSGRREVRQAAVVALCEVLGDRALPLARERLTSPDRGIRKAALIGIARHCGDDGIALALPELAQRAASPRAHERCEAAEIAGEIGALGQAALLSRLLHDPEVEVRRAAAEACSKIADPELVPLLLGKLDEAALRSSVLHALEHAPATATTALCAVLDDPGRDLRERVLMTRVMARIGDSACEPALRRALAPDEDIELRAAAAAALCERKRTGRLGATATLSDMEIEGLCDAIDLCSRASDELGRGDAFTARVYREHADQHLELLLSLVGLTTELSAVERIRWNLFHDLEQSGSHAIELLEELLPRRWSARVVPAVSQWRETREPRGSVLSHPTEARLRRADTWLRAVTVHHLNRVPSRGGDSQPLTLTLAEARLYELLDIVEFLSRVPLFTELRVRSLLDQAEISEWVQLGEGQRLFEQGDVGDALYVICDGEARVLVNDHEVAHLRAGECVGDLALLDDEPRSAGVVMATDARLLRISSERWKTLLLTQPAIARAMLRTLAERIRRTQASATAHPADEPPARRSQMFRAQELGLGELVATMSFLQQIELFRDLETAELANLAGIAQEVRVLPGDHLFEEGDVGESLYLVCSGTIAVEVAGREVARLCRGACLGEMAIISGLPRSATAKALDAGQLLRIGASDFTSLVDARPEIALGLLRTLAGRLRRSSTRR